MADGDYFAKPISTNEDNNAVGNPILVQLSDGTAAIGVTTGALDVNIDNASLVVTATDLDIRDLTHVSDSVAIGDGGSVILDIAVSGAIAGATDNGIAPKAIRDDALTTLVDADGDYVSLRTDSTGALWVNNGGGTQTVTTAFLTDSAAGATDAVFPAGAIRDDALATLTPVDGDYVGLRTDSTGALWVQFTNTTIAVTATDLDIRDLTHVSDSVKVGDGTDFLAVNTDGSINVNVVSTVLADEFHVENIGVAVAQDATSTHTVTASGGVMLVTKVTVAGSGGIKYVIKNNAVVVMTGFFGRDGNMHDIEMVPAVEVANTQALTIERTNRQNQAVDVYSSVFGRQL